MKNGGSRQKVKGSGKRWRARLKVIILDNKLSGHTNGGGTGQKEEGLDKKWKGRTKVEGPRQNMKGLDNKEGSDKLEELKKELKG